MAGTVRMLMLDQGLDDEQRKRRFADQMTSIFRDRLPDESWVQRYEAAIPVEHCWQGLARYWQKRL
jgi:hypothetical protein